MNWDHVGMIMWFMDALMVI